jgi:hypothetical protein
MALSKLMTGWGPVSCIALFAAFVAAEEPPLPSMSPPPGRDDGLSKPTAIIKPPASSSAKSAVIDARELALQAMELQFIEEQTRKQLAAAAKQGDSAALKQLIVMLGPVDAAVSRSPSPPATQQGRIALIGLKGGDKVSKSLEEFFGAPLTPEREKQLLETVKTQLASKDQPAMDVRVAGWWPKEGVMAVSVVPRG